MTMGLMLTTQSRLWGGHGVIRSLLLGLAVHSLPLDLLCHLICVPPHH